MFEVALNTTSAFICLFDKVTGLTNVLNDVVLDATILNQAPIFNGDRLKIYYATQVSVAPPTFVLFVNDPSYMHFSYQRMLENKLREAFELSGSPIKIVLRKKEN